MLKPDFKEFQQSSKKYEFKSRFKKKLRNKALVRIRNIMNIKAYLSKMGD